MELGLSLGDANTSTTTSSPNSFFLSKKNVISTCCDDDEKKKGLGFCMALGINSSPSGKVEQEDEENNTSEEDTNNNTLPLQLDLLPLVPVPTPLNTIHPSLHWSSDNGNLYIYQFLSIYSCVKENKLIYL